MFFITLMENFLLYIFPFRTSHGNNHQREWLTETSRLLLGHLKDNVFLLEGCKGQLTAIRTSGTELESTAFSSAAIISRDKNVCIHGQPVHAWRKNFFWLWIPRFHGVNSHLHWLLERTAVGQTIFAEGTQVTATPVINDIALSSTPVWAHCGTLEGL